jgi:hypothetical protein
LADKNVIKSTPIANVTWRGNGSFEAGTQATLSYSISFTDGKYKYWSSQDKTNSGKEPNMGSNLQTDSVQFNGETKNT